MSGLVWFVSDIATATSFSRSQFGITSADSLFFGSGETAFSPYSGTPSIDLFFSEGQWLQQFPGISIPAAISLVCGAVNLVVPYSHTSSGLSHFVLTSGIPPTSDFIGLLYISKAAIPPPAPTFDTISDILSYWCENYVSEPSGEGLNVMAIEDKLQLIVDALNCERSGVVKGIACVLKDSLTDANGLGVADAVSNIEPVWIENDIRTESCRIRPDSTEF